MSAAWNPWRALRSRSRVELRFADLAGRKGLWQRDSQGDLIILDAGLDRRSRRCVLAHELVHAERGIGFGAATAETMQREEEQVRREVARRLVPPAELARYLDRIPDGTGVTATDVADEFDVDTEVAAKAMELHGLSTGDSSFV